MAAPRKFDEEFRARAVRMYRDRLQEAGGSKLGARKYVGALLDLNPATLRNWVEAVERADGTRPAAVSSAGRAADSEEVRALKRRVAELERANEILKTASAFFAQAELDRRLK
jgi:transposase-like protein